jgi:hypothetical protein
MGEADHAPQLLSVAVSLKIDDVAAREPPAAAVPSIAGLGARLLLRLGEPAKKIVISPN